MKPDTMYRKVSLMLSSHCLHFPRHINRSVVKSPRDVINIVETLNRRIWEYRSLFCRKAGKILKNGKKTVS